MSWRETKGQVSGSPSHTLAGSGLCSVFAAQVHGPPGKADLKLQRVPRPPGSWRRLCTHHQPAAWVRWEGSRVLRPAPRAPHTRRFRPQCPRLPFFRVAVTHTPSLHSQGWSCSQEIEPRANNWRPDRSAGVNGVLYLKKQLCSRSRQERIYLGKHSIATPYFAHFPLSHPALPPTPRQ